jgi:hypothetical protein
LKVRIFRCRLNKAAHIKSRVVIGQHQYAELASCSNLIQYVSVIHLQCPGTWQIINPNVNLVQHWGEFQRFSLFLHSFECNVTGRFNSLQWIVAIPKIGFFDHGECMTDGNCICCIGTPHCIDYRLSLQWRVPEQRAAIVYLLTVERFGWVNFICRVQNIHRLWQQNFTFYCHSERKEVTRNGVFWIYETCACCTTPFKNFYVLYTTVLAWVLVGSYTELYYLFGIRSVLHRVASITGRRKGDHEMGSNQSLL